MHAERTRPSYRLKELSLRMLGQNVTFTRSQWQYLLDDLQPDCELARRISRLISEEDRA